MTLPQGEIPPAANVLATLGTILWCIQLVPQVWHNWRMKKTEGLPGSMMMLWALCSIPFGVYAIVQQFAIAIQIQPQIFGILALVNWGQTLFYNDKWPQRRATLAVVLLCILFGAVEVMLVLTLRIPYSRGIGWPILVIGILAAVLLAGGLVPPYREIWKRGGRVIGINWIFLTIDWFGALFSLLALVEQQTFDALGCALYVIVLVLEAGIFLSHWIWLLRRRFRNDNSDAEEGADGEQAVGSGGGVPEGHDDDESVASKSPRAELRDGAGDGGQIDCRKGEGDGGGGGAGVKEGKSKGERDGDREND